MADKLSIKKVMWTKFPERVWEQSLTGWYSRPVDKDDLERRKKYTDRIMMEEE